METIDLGPTGEPGRTKQKYVETKRVSSLQEGTHAHDVYITGKILYRARKTGMVQIKDTADGDIFVYYEPNARVYDVSQVVDGKTVTFVHDTRHYVQEYLIDLRERSRKTPRKRAKKQQEDA